MHHPTYRIAHTTVFVTPVMDHWLEREIAQWVSALETLTPTSFKTVRLKLNQTYSFDSLCTIRLHDSVFFSFFFSFFVVLFVFISMVGFLLLLFGFFCLVFFFFFFGGGGGWRGAGVCVCVCVFVDVVFLVIVVVSPTDLANSGHGNIVIYLKIALY